MLIVEIMLLLIDASRTYSCVRTAVSICQIPVKDSQEKDYLTACQLSHVFW